MAHDDAVLWLPDGTSTEFARTASGKFLCPVASCAHNPGGLASKVTLLEHVRLAHEWTHYNRFMCAHEGCPRRFATASKLKVHAETHDEDKRLEAAQRKREREDDEASKKKKFSHTIPRVPVVKITVDGVEKFKCPLCDTLERSYARMLAHRKTVHADAPAPPRPMHAQKRQRLENVAMCACAYCLKSFTNTGSLNDHYSSCADALRAFTAALPSDDITACVRLIEKLPGRVCAAWNDVFADGAGSASDSDAESEIDSENSSDDAEDAEDAEDEDGFGSGVGAGAGAAERVPERVPGLTKSIATTLLLYRVSASNEPLRLRCCVDGCAATMETCCAHACHMRAVHGPRRTTLFRCELCAYSNASQSKVRTHMRDVHTTERLFQCSVPECPATFKTASDARKHAASVHADEDAAVRCRICDRLCRNVRALQNHLFVHVERKHVCETCGDAFTFASKLRKHQRKHPGPDGLFTCACGDAFPLLDQLDWHGVDAHGVLPTPCTACGTLFTSRARMLRHHKVAHENSDPAFTPGASDGERVIWRALYDLGLCFRTEERIGNGLRLDFALTWANGAMCAAIEYDGAHHFRPSSGTCERAWEFLHQIQRDCQKTRQLRAAGVPLVRLSRNISAAHVRAAVERIRMVLLFEDAVASYDEGYAEHVKRRGRPSAEDARLDAIGDSLRAILQSDEAAGSYYESYADYVYGKAYTSPAAAHLRADTWSDATMALDDAVRLLLNQLPDVAAVFAKCSMECGMKSCTAVCETRLKLAAVAEAALVLVLATQPHDAASAEVKAACQTIARRVPEFNGTAPTFRPLRLTTAQREHLDQMLHARGANTVRDVFPNMRPGTFSCWEDSCSAVFNTNAKRPADEVLRHLSSVHGSPLKVMCAVGTCDATAVCRRDLVVHVTAAHDGHTKTDLDRVRCGVEHCSTTRFPTWAHWFRHANECHGAQFPAFMLLKCSTCAQTFNTTSSMDRHLCT